MKRWLIIFFVTWSSKLNFQYATKSTAFGHEGMVVRAALTCIGTVSNTATVSRRWSYDPDVNVLIVSISSILIRILFFMCRQQHQPVQRAGGDCYWRKTVQCRMRQVPLFLNYALVPVPDPTAGFVSYPDVNLEFLIWTLSTDFTTLDLSHFYLF